jgi:hypothetical protein
MTLDLPASSRIPLTQLVMTRRAVAWPGRHS